MFSLLCGQVFIGAHTLYAHTYILSMLFIYTCEHATNIPTYVHVHCMTMKRVRETVEMKVPNGFSTIQFKVLMYKTNECVITITL